MVVSSQIAMVDGQVALGTIRVGGAQHGADVFEIQAVVVEQRGIDIHADGRQRAAAHEHLSYACDLRELLLQDGGSCVIKARGVHASAK